RYYADLPTEFPATAAGALQPYAIPCPNIMDLFAMDLFLEIGDLKLDGLAELQAVTSEMVRLMETATVPILAAIGRHILTLVEDSS
ncbi:hypothetical protein ACJX0J_023330, partial [Zea mays]